MGTPEFAVASLKKLHLEGYNIVGVVTAPDRPSGRGLKVNSSEVKNYAERVNLPILQPVSLKNDLFINELKKLNANLFIVVAFRMLPEIIWKLPNLGTINLHGSLLPKYRGAAPINWAIIKGEKETGVTTFFINETIDTGSILLQQKIQIEEAETTGDIHDKLMEIGASLLSQTIYQLLNSKLIPIKQNLKDNFPLAPKIFKADCQLNFTRPIQEIQNMIRGLSPYPTAWMKIIHKNSKEEKNLKIFKSSIHSYSSSNEIQINSAKELLMLQLKDGILIIHELQLEGKRKMNAVEFMNGFAVSEWELSD